MSPRRQGRERLYVLAANANKSQNVPTAARSVRASNAWKSLHLAGWWETRLDRSVAQQSSAGNRAASADVHQQHISVHLKLPRHKIWAQLHHRYGKGGVQPDDTTTAVAGEPVAGGWPRP